MMMMMLILLMMLPWRSFSLAAAVGVTPFKGQRSVELALLSDANDDDDGGP